MKTASNLLLVQDGLVLSVSRRGDPTMWGLPGGKVDLGETSEDACTRETFEETGVQVLRTQITPLVSMISRGTVDFWSTTYLYIGPRIDTSVLRVEPGLFMDWKSLDDLTNPKISPFSSYNFYVRVHYEQFKGANGS